MDSSSPFAGILIGQPTLSTRLRQGVFAALDQRISVRYELAGMDLAESVAYLRHHIELAGRTDQVFADDAAARMHRYANGIPVPSTTQLGLRSWLPPPTEKASSTTSARRKQWPSSHATEQARVATAPIGGHHAHRSAPSRVLTQSCRTVLTQ